MSEGYFQSCRCMQSVLRAFLHHLLYQLGFNFSI
jgi:hypothetical protein